MHELLQAFNGQEVDGRLFGMEGLVKLPVFERVAPYLSPDGQVQINSLAENHERWAVDIKWHGQTERKERTGKTGGECPQPVSDTLVHF